MLNVKIAD